MHRTQAPVTYQLLTTTQPLRHLCSTSRSIQIQILLAALALHLLLPLLNH